MYIYITWFLYEPTLAQFGTLAKYSDQRLLKLFDEKKFKAKRI